MEYRPSQDSSHGIRLELLLEAKEQGMSYEEYIKFINKHEHSHPSDYEGTNIPSGYD